VTARTTDEWRGATADSAIPPRVRLRVWDACGGRCAICARKLRAPDRWDLDHKVALVNGGEHREGNLQVACSWCHAEKTAADVAEKARTAAVRKRHLGIRPPSRMPGARSSKLKKKIDGSVVLR
jgi:5-methylcytosine-specific restriction endonuclease McrA